MDALAPANAHPILDNRTTWQALKIWTLYRTLVAILLAVLFFTPVLGDTHPESAARSLRLITALLLLLAPALLVVASRHPQRLGLQTLVGASVDLATTLLVLSVTGGLESGVGTMLVGSMVLVSAIVPLRFALLFAAIGTLIVLWPSLAGALFQGLPIARITPAGMLGAAYFVTTLVGSYLTSRVRESQDLARQRSADLANLAELNELIIERMRTGIMIIDQSGAAHLMNEAAWYLAGMPDRRSAELATFSPRLVTDLEAWRELQHQPHDSLRLGAGVPSIVPRFAALTRDPRGDVLVFLEDTSILSRRAHELTLASLGRLSASIAHEIRNPLAAISHSAQLLEESPDLGPADRRLSAIIVRHCDRMNDIVENVLHLARQERAQPASLRLDTWIVSFVEEFRRFHDLGGGHLECKGTDVDTWIMFDVSQLQQVLWNLCQNALKYGRRPGEAARVTIDWSNSRDPDPPWLEVCDEGPGIPEEQRARIFEPFFTSSRDGSGLGLYLCNQLVEANQGSIRYEYDTTGSRFRIEFARGRPEAAPEAEGPVSGTEARGTDVATAQGAG